ncbi:hypothetical protein [Alicyclobacillus macrosporangiidus]|uniref:Uncharacterized protein n=1 Tax=Alicyclobacillus macrosporangiidus TaxID=392015 RepID=A0A1I7L2B4_9BACL|nr:hypothetical protein [Alicyclobacillus macrosporangiidus]SFV03883.1 hypothetical protein SAMN05421543_12354 [Alicyclobacillus macrosporangiidus]
MSNPKPTTVYRIPKNIRTKLTLWRLDVTGWIIFSLVVILAILFVFLGTHQLGWLAKKFAIAALVVFLTWIALSDETLLSALRQVRYHRKHATMLRWRSDPNAVLQKIQGRRQ